MDVRRANEVLGLTGEASSDELVRAHKEMLEKYAEDEIKTGEVEAAYDVLVVHEPYRSSERRRYLQTRRIFHAFRLRVTLHQGDDRDRAEQRAGSTQRVTAGRRKLRPRR